ncbi:MAG: alkene reductase [Myxococcales bacterium]|nr:alkene reductase [Myxococcales bacterium]
MTSKLFEPLTIGSFQTTNRIFMAPMTRGRADAERVPTEIMATYYRQRSGAGLIVTEGTFVSQQGAGWVNAPGIWNDAQGEGWRPVTDAVHQAGGRIFLQLWHMGRVSHPDFYGDGALPVGPSAIAAKGESHTPKGKKDYVTPRALEASELPGIVDDFRRAAARAVAAGFDGVEIHGANGYLIDQFIRDRANQRDDDFGGSIKNRWRFPLQIIDAVAGEVGAERTAIRFSPVGQYNDMADSDPVASYTYGAEQIAAKHALAYVHLVEAIGGMMHNADAPPIHPHVRAALGATPLLLNGGYDFASASAALEEGVADAITFGVFFLANPDLPARFEKGSTEFNAPDFATLYTNDAKGYTDYPAL